MTRIPYVRREELGPEGQRLWDTGRLDQETYDAAHRILGDAGMMGLVSLCGYYTLSLSC